MSSTIATDGDPIVQMHKNTAQSARAAATALPMVVSAGMRPSHAGILENALGETRRTLEELARVSDVGAAGAGALGEQDAESGRKFSGWESGELQRRGVPTGETRVV